MPDIVVMFFLLGLLSGLVKSDLAIPKAAYDVLSLLLMLTIGLKGGMALHGNLGLGLLAELLFIGLLGFLIPLLLFPVLRPFYDALEPLSWLLIRCACGLILAVHGWGKVSRGAEAMGAGGDRLSEAG